MNSKKIMIIDDDPRIREMYKDALEINGFQVVLRPDGKDIINHIKEERPDLVFLDIMIPDIQGLDLLRIIKDDPKTKNTKVIIFSALSDESAKKIAAKNGALMFLTKSEISILELINEIKKVLT